MKRYVESHIEVRTPNDVKDAFLAPYYGWLVERLTEAIRGDTLSGEIPEVPIFEQNREPGTTADVSFFTSREVREAVKCHLNFVVADTVKWEQSATYFIDRHQRVEAFVKNSGLGFTIGYFNNGQTHDYVPDFVIRLKGTRPMHLILETKGYDPLSDVKSAAAKRWVAAVNADGHYGQWSYALVKEPSKIPLVLDGIDKN